MSLDSKFVAVFELEALDKLRKIAEIGCVKFKGRACNLHKIHRSFGRFFWSEGECVIYNRIQTKGNGKARSVKGRKWSNFYALNFTMGSRIYQTKGTWLTTFLQTLEQV